MLNEEFSCGCVFNDVPQIIRDARCASVEQFSCAIHCAFVPLIEAIEDSYSRDRTGNCNAYHILFRYVISTNDLHLSHWRLMKVGKPLFRMSHVYDLIDVLSQFLHSDS